MLSSLKVKDLFLTLAVSSLVAVPTNVNASGFEILEQSARGLGSAFAGSNTGFGDGSSAYYNPAALTKLEKLTYSVGGHVIVPQADFSNNGSSFPAFGGLPIGGGNGGDGGEVALVGNLYMAAPLSDDVTFGFAINSPFGLKTQYNSNWVGRYHAIKSELTTINLNPSVGVKIDDSLSIGAGVRVMYADAELSNAIDFGTIAVSQLGQQTASALGLSPQGADGLGTVKGDDWAVGFNVGALYQVDEDLEVGLTFRSKVDVSVSGDATFQVPMAAIPLTQTGAFTNTGDAASVGLPESISFGGRYNLNEDWILMADATWTAWSRFNELRVTFDSVQPDAVTPEGWDDVWRFSLGTQGEISEGMRVRFGTTYDASPVSDSSFRTPRIPDSDRFWLAGGVGVDLCESAVLDLSYTHIFVEDADSSNMNSTGALLSGNWDASVDIVSVSITGSI